MHDSIDLGEYELPIGSAQFTHLPFSTDCAAEVGPSLLSIVQSEVLDSSPHN